MEGVGCQPGAPGARGAALSGRIAGYGGARRRYARPVARIRVSHRDGDG